MPKKLSQKPLFYCNAVISAPPSSVLVAVYSHIRLPRPFSARSKSHHFATKRTSWTVSNLKSFYHFFLAYAAAVWYGFPSRTVTVIGVTGTKGKTTVVELLHTILSANGDRVASSSSLRFRIGDQITPNNLKMTMPGRFFIQRFLYRAKQAGCRYAVLEVTSQGIAQFRHRCIRFDAAVLTNIAPEHIEAHGGFENYIQAKRDLFRRVVPAGFAVLNQDDPEARGFADASSLPHLVWYGKEGIIKNAQRYKTSDVRDGEDGIIFSLDDLEIRSRLQGSFNLINIIAGIAVGLCYDIPLERIASAVKTIPGIAGRMEYIQTNPYAVVVDYAHTPDSLRVVYETVARKHKRLICVLGSAGGGRDTWKRPAFAYIAEKFCDSVMLTNEDPYDENPEKIITDIEAGFSSGFLSRVKKILDRKTAIRRAMQCARAGDAVIITGKGAEPWMMGARGARIPWDDRAIAREAITHFFGHPL